MPDPDAYTAEAQAAGLVAYDGGVAVLCDSHWTEATEVTVTRVPQEPDLDLSAVDRAVTALIRCPSGELHVVAPQETGFGERVLRLPPGEYELLVCGDRFGTGDKYGDDGDDRYAIWLWPASAS